MKTFQEILDDKSISDDLKSKLLPPVLEDARERDRAKRLENETSNRWRTLFLSPPFVAAVTSLATVYITSVYNKRIAESGNQSQRNIEYEKTLTNRDIEFTKLQFDIIKKALDETKSPTDRANSLLFLHEVDLLKGLNAVKLKEWAEKKESLPSFSSGQIGVNITSTGRTYKEALGPDVYGADTTKIYPTPDQISDVLGEPKCQKFISISVPFPMSVAWDETVDLTSIRVNVLAKPFFEAAFANIVANRAQEHARAFGGTHMMRKTRGGSKWSSAAWAIQIDIDPINNQLKWGDDKFTMHPDVVRSFKEAGFAWSGDRNFDAMDFVLSTETLAKIASQINFNKPSC
jgi:hypothetical protein